MTAKSLMFMGTGSDVGKSLLVAGLCRAFANRGLRVAPFKPQNMSNNAAVTADGGEIGRAQALQARACRRAPVTAMNPVLLKPEHETGAQLIVRGQRVGSMPARDYWKKRGELLPEVLAAFDELAASADLVIVEGAGSASEVNLRHNDIANFGFARAARRAGAAGRRYPARRRHRLARRHLRRHRSRRCRAHRRHAGQQVPGRSGAV